MIRLGISHKRHELGRTRLKKPPVEHSAYSAAPRMACLISAMKILPSPIWPVRADFMIASMTLSTRWGHDFNFGFWKKAHRLFGAAMNLGMPFLMSETYDLGNVDARNPNLPQRILDFVEFEWLDDGDDAFHGMTSPP
jgi:hypothetical protein